MIVQRKTLRMLLYAMNARSMRKLALSGFDELFKHSLQSSRRCYRVIQNTANVNSESFTQTAEASKVLQENYLKILAKVKEGGGQKGVERQLKQGKLLVRDRLSKLLDDHNEFLELSAIAGWMMPYGSIPAASIITGIGRVRGKEVMVIANDGSVKGGTVFPITLKKQLRAQQIAEQLALPCVYIVDSGGAFLPLQAEIFIEGGKTFYNEAVMSSQGIPQVAVVCGMCTAGGAYVPTMADEAVMVHRTGCIYLAGPPLVKAATGEVVSAEELGGATMHSRVSGCVDHFAQNEEESYEICRDVIESLNLPSCLPRSNPVEPLFDPAELSGLVMPHDPNPRQVIARVVDGSQFQEFKPLYGLEIVTGFAYIHGYPIGIMANDKGVITCNAAVKASHFVQVCTQRRLPIIFLQNGADGPVDDEADLIKAVSRFITAVACTDIPKITIHTGAFHGMTQYAMGSKAMGVDFVFNWPSTTVGITDPNVLCDLVGQGEDHEKVKERVMQSTSGLHAASNVWTDGMILPQDTRKVLSKCLEIFEFSKKMKSFAAESASLQQPTFRM